MFIHTEITIYMWRKAYKAITHDLIVLENKAGRIVHGVSLKPNAEKALF